MNRARRIELISYAASRLARSRQMDQERGNWGYPKLTAFWGQKAMLAGMIMHFSSFTQTYSIILLI